MRVRRPAPSTLAPRHGCPLLLPCAAQDEELARNLVELGYRGDGDILKREEFEARKKAEREKHLHKESAPPPLASMGKNLSDKPFLQALATREELVRNGKLTTIIFVRDFNSKGHEVSGYIDLAHRLKTESFEAYFSCKRRFMPRPTDLAFFNWDTQTSTSASSPNFQVIADNGAGLLFKNKRDRKVINVNPEASPGDNTQRSELRTTEYLHVVFYDHTTRRKG